MAKCVIQKRTPPMLGTCQMLLLVMPVEIIKEITQYLPTRDYFRLHQTCRYLYLMTLPFNAAWEMPDYFKLLESGNCALAMELMSHLRFDTSYRYHKQDTMQWMCPFAYACTRGCIRIVNRLLLHPKTKLCLQGQYGLRLASKHGHLEIVDKLLQIPIVDPSDHDNEAVRLAAGGGHYDIICRLLMDPRVDPSACNNSCIKLACMHGHFKVVERLLQDPRVDPTTEDHFCLKWASREGHLEVVKLLLEHPLVKQHKHYECAIMWARCNKHVKVVKKLIKACEK
ncbi:ankyrin repeat-containing domain protein [Gorgonomyces haynaldii]|nr:ankyrin repeat-containing domain protein [Gorgonomyces haynaldii]